MEEMLGSTIRLSRSVEYSTDRLTFGRCNVKGAFNYGGSRSTANKGVQLQLIAFYYNEELSIMVDRVLPQTRALYYG